MPFGRRLTFTHRQPPFLWSRHCMRAEGIRRGLRAFTSSRSVRTWIGPSYGATCEMCERKITAAEIECEVVVANGQALRPDVPALSELLDDLIRPQQQRRRDR